MSSVTSKSTIHGLLSWAFGLWLGIAGLGHAQQVSESGGATRAPVISADSLRTAEIPWHTSQVERQPTRQPTPQPVITASAQRVVDDTTADSRLQPSRKRTGALRDLLTSTQENHTPLAPPSSELTEAEPSSGGGIQSLISVATSLMLVLGLFFAVTWFYRKTNNGSLNRNLPPEVVAVLGRTSIAARQQLTVVKFGPKIVLVSSVQGESKTLSEITDPTEVRRLTQLCEQHPTPKDSGFGSLFSREASA